MISYQDLNEAVVLPHRNEDGKGGVISASGSFVESSAFHEGHGGVYDYDTTDVRMFEKTAIFIGTIHPTWGHVITDGLKKLWFLDTAEGKGLLTQGAELVCCTIGSQPLPSYTRKIFALAGIDQVTEIVCPTHFHRLIIPDNSIVCDNDYRTSSLEFIQVIDKIKGNLPHFEDLPKKVYFSRLRLQDYGIEMGEYEVARLFKKLGYHIYAPECLPIEKQLALVTNCKEFVATEGSVSHISVFCNRNAHCIFLLKFGQKNPYQRFINEAIGYSFDNVAIHHSKEKSCWHWGPYYLLVTPALKRLLGVSGIYRPYWLRVSYWWYQVRDNKYIRWHVTNKKWYHYIEQRLKAAQIKKIDCLLN